MIQIFTLQLAANEVREVSVSGEYFELRNALFPIALIELLDRNGAILARLENPEQSDFVRPGPFGTVRITNGATAQTVKHFYGTGDAGSRRTSGLVRIDGASDVSVIDNEKRRSLLGLAFVFSVGGVASPVGVTKSSVLFNPPGSGQNLVIRSTRYSSSVAQSYGIEGVSSVGSGLTDVAAIGLVKKRPGGIASFMQAWQTGATNFNGVSLGQNSFVTAQLAAGLSDTATFREPLVISPGFGLRFFNTMAATDHVVSAEYVEELFS